MGTTDKLPRARRLEALSGAPLSTSRRGRRALPFLVLLAAALSLSLSSSALAFGQEAPNKQLTPLQRGLAFYRGNAVTIIAGSVGGAVDLVARALAPYMTTYLHARSVVVENIGGGGNVPEGDTIAASTPDGLIVGFLNTPSFVGNAITTGSILNFNPAREAFIAGQGPSLEVLSSAISSPFTTFAAIKNAGAPPKVVVDSPGAANDQLHILFGLLSTKVQFISGYASVPLTEAGFLRGDGPLTMNSLSELGSAYASNLARPIASSAPVPAGTTYGRYLISVPTFAQLLAKYMPKKPSKALRAGVAALNAWDAMGQPFVTQTGVAGYKLDALRAAVAWAYKQPGFKTAMLVGGNSPKYVSPDVAKTQYITVVSAAKAVACYIGGTC